jgi:hypothetical protein
MENNTNPGQNPEQNPAPIAPQNAPQNESLNTVATNASMTSSIRSFFKENKWAMIIIAISLIILGIGAYLVLVHKPEQGAIHPKVDVTIDAPQNIPSGSEIVYKITVADKDSASIKNVELDLIYPQGFSFTDSTPKPTKLNGTHFSLPIIDPGQDATIMIKGNIQGNADETKTISALMHYSFSNINSDFISQAQAQTQIKTANIVLQFDGQDKVSNNQDVTYTLNYTNFTDQPVENFKISLTTPKAFFVKSQNPDPTYQQVWQLGTLDPNKSGKIQLVGSFQNASVGDSQLFTAQAEGSAPGGKSFVLSAAQLPVTVQAKALEADVIYTGDQTVKPGASMSYKVAYQNNSGKIVSGVLINVTLDGPFDLDNLELNHGTINGNVITWDASQIPALKTLSVGQQGEIRFNVNVKNPVSKSGQKNLVVIASPAMQSSEYQQAFDGQSVRTKIQTQVQIASVVQYSGGSNPPQVGQSSTYNIEISLKNASNDAANTRVVMNLPIANFDLNTVNSAERSLVDYDKNTKQLTWNAGTLAANAGSFAPLRKLQFQVTFTPSASARNKPVTLVNNISMTGTDSFTNVPINQSYQDLSTSNDPAGTGTVR